MKKKLESDAKRHIFQNVASLVTLLRDFKAIKICCFCYNGKNKTSDVLIIKICCLRYVEKSKTFIYNSINAKNWLVV